MYDVADVARELKVSVATVRKWVLQKKLPYRKIGTLVRFLPEDIERIKREGLPV